MQTSFILSFLAVLCLSHQTIAMEVVDECVQLASADVSKPGGKPPLPNQRGACAGCACGRADAKKKAALPAKVESVSPQSEQVKIQVQPTPESTNQ